MTDQMQKIKEALEKALPFIGYQAHVPDVLKQCEEALAILNAMKPVCVQQNASDRTQESSCTADDTQSGKTSPPQSEVADDE